jgi:hypothetical protein
MSPKETGGPQKSTNMKKRSKRTKTQKIQPEQDPYLLRIGHGERLYKIYCFRPIAGLQYHFEYRILTKEKKDGMLEMVSYSYKVEDGIPQKTGICRSTGIKKEQMDDIVQNMMITTHTRPEEFEELDLSGFSTIEEQLEFLKQQDRVDTTYLM